MTIHLFVHPNPNQQSPKIWAYERTPSGDRIWYGSVGSGWKTQLKHNGYGTETADKKRREGYLLVSDCKDIKEAEGFRDAYKAAISGWFEYDGNNGVQIDFGTMLKSLGLNARPRIPSMPLAQMKPATAPTATQPPQTAAARKPPRKVAIKLDGDVAVCVL